MRKLTSKTIAAIAILTLLNAAPASAQVTWQANTTPFNWSNSADWSGNVVPNSSTTSVAITDGTSTVTFSPPETVANLALASGNTLTWGGGGGTLTVAGTSISNNGTISVGDGNILIGNAVTLSGSGTVTLGPGVINASGALTLTNQSNIQGSGQIGNSTALSLINQGTVDANGGGNPLYLNGFGATTNTGLLEANGGILNISNNVNNAGGTITATNSGTVNVGLNVPSTIQGGTLTTSNGGVMQTNGPATLDGSTEGAITLSNGSTYTAGGGTTNVLGTINLGTSGTGSNIALAGTMTLTGATTLAGHGDYGLRRHQRERCADPDQ